MKHTIQIILLSLLVGCSATRRTADVELPNKPRINHQYDSVTIPPNSAPLNFAIEEQGDRFRVEISSPKLTEPIVTESNDQQVSIPEGQWARILDESRADSISIRVLVLRGHKWFGYAPMTIRVAPTPIDGYLVYRLIYPGYSLWDNMGIYERDMHSFDQRALITNSSTDNGCVNCHTFSANSPSKMMLHLRKNKAGTVVLQDGNVKKMTLKCGSMISEGVYASWSREGEWIAYSTNDTRQNFHASGLKPVEVFDKSSDLVIYNPQSDKIISDKAIYGTQFRETFPEWSPKGDYLYFCRTKALSDTIDRGVAERSRYDLCRISFDKQTEKFGSVEVIYEASKIERSVSLPKCSPDGRFVVFVQSDYGTFSIWHKQSDLYMMDTKDGSVRALDELNSDDTESYHSFSSDGRWLVFSSRRLDGLYTRPFIAHFDPMTAHFDKPYILPQKRADHYDRLMESYNLPQLITSRVDKKQLLNAVNLPNVSAHF